MKCRFWDMRKWGQGRGFTTAVISGLPYLGNEGCALLLILGYMVPKNLGVYVIAPNYLSHSGLKQRQFSPITNCCLSDGSERGTGKCSVVTGTRTGLEWSGDRPGALRSAAD